MPNCENEPIQHIHTSTYVYIHTYIRVHALSLSLSVTRKREEEETKERDRKKNLPLRIYGFFLFRFEGIHAKVGGPVPWFANWRSVSETIDGDVSRCRFCARGGNFRGRGFDIVRISAKRDGKMKKRKMKNEKRSAETTGRMTAFDVIWSVNLRSLW